MVLLERNTKSQHLLHTMKKCLSCERNRRGGSALMNIISSSFQCRCLAWARSLISYMKLLCVPALWF
jgi:hypothetical protein